MKMKIKLNHYDIFFEKDFSSFQEAILPLSLKTSKIMVVFDSNTAFYYQKSFMDFMKGFCLKPFSFVFEAGEENKNLTTVSSLYEELIQNQFQRNDVLIAFGGGVVGDLTGFAAATYLRGIRFIQIPTSLLAMADSGIGGKTGVDFLAYKNMVGAFYQPSLVYMNLSLLTTLPEREYLSGMAEIIKSAYIKKASLLPSLIEKAKNIVSRSYTELEPILYEACLIKKEVVENDFMEKGERALLNFGHTLGHAIEKLLSFRLLHGECVSIGMMLAMDLSIKKGYMKEDDLKKMEELLSNYKLPTRLPNDLSFSPEDVLAASKLDKKMEAGGIKFILLKEEGKAVIDKTVSDEEILYCLKEMM